VKLGKKPARLGAYKLHLADYLDPLVLPQVPVNFGHENLIADYQVLANDSVGDCVIAGALHETMIWGAESGRTVRVSDSCAIENYAAATGYDPAQVQPDGSNPTDQGADVQAVAQWRIRPGIHDAGGVVHTIAGYAFVNPRSVTDIRTAAWLFGAVGIGFDLPASAMTQFDEGLPWTTVPGSPSLGGHYVPLVGWWSGYGVGITWGRKQLITFEFIATHADEAIAYLSPDMLARPDGESPEGFDIAALRADLTALEARP
jgi:hypothetical protein